MLFFHYFIRVWYEGISKWLRFAPRLKFSIVGGNMLSRHGYMGAVYIYTEINKTIQRIYIQPSTRETSEIPAVTAAYV